MVGPDDEGDNRNATIDQSKQLLAPLDASAGQTAAVDDLAPSVPVKRPAKQADLRGFFGGGAKAKVQTEHGLEAAEAPAAVSAQPHALEGATCDAGPVDEPLVPEPAEKPKRTRKRSYVTSQDADAEEEPVKSSKASRRKSNEPKPAKDDTAGEGEGEAPGKGKKAPMAGQRNILSFFGGPKGTGAAAVQVAEAEKVAEPASVTILESSLEEDIQKAESEHDESVLGAEPAEKPRRRSPRERRKPKVIESAEPEAPVPTKPTRKRSRRTQSTKELATKSVADSTDEKGVISIDSESEAEPDKVVLPSVPGDRDVLEVPDFFLTPFERARKKQLLAQKAAREEVERHSKEAALFAKKQIGEEAVQDGHWFFGKRVASGAADSVDGDAVTTKAVEGVDAPYPAGDIIHFRGSLTPYEELTSNFGAFPLQPSAGQKHPLANFGTEQWGNVFGDATRLDVPKLSSSEVQIRHESLDWVIEQLKTSYGAAVEEGACRRLYDMLVSGERFEKLDEPELWVDKYRPLAITDLVGNVDVASYLANWMEKRKVDVDQMQVASSRKGKKKDKKPKRPKKRGRKNDLDDFIVDEDDDDGYWSSDGEMRGIPSTVLLVGPTGSGKTAMIEAVAAQLDYSILEINEGQKRDAKSVLNEIGEATVNHTLVTSGVPAATKTGANGGLANLFAAADKAIEKQIEPSLDVDMSDKDEPPAAKKSRLRKRTVVDSDSEVEAGAVPTNALELDSAAAAPTNAKTDGMEIDAVASSAPLNKRKLLARPAFTPADEESKQASAGQTLIVFDNIDIVFEEDKSFWNAIASMAERSKRPIVLTANSVDVFQQLPTSLGEATIVKETSKPSLDQLAAYANLVCVLEGVWVAKEELEGLVERCEFQIGRVLRVLELASLVSRNAMTSAPSHGQLDLAICKLDSELVDRDKLLQELGGVAMGCVLGATDGLLGMLAEISPKDDRVDVVERPDGGAQQEQSAIFDESQGEALQHQNAVENVEAETGNGVPMERLITDSPTRSATADDESVRVPRKQTTADAVHANILESYSKSCEILSDWDADVRTGLLFCSVLDTVPDNIPGQELCSSVTAPVPKWSIGRPSLLDRLHPKSSEWNTYLSEPAYDTFFCSLHGRIAVASFDKIVGGVSITMHDDARLWTTVREARRVDLECENLEKFDMLTMSHLMPYDLPCWAPKSLELEAIPAVASILRADKFRLENDISEEERPDRRRVTRASRQKRRYFLDLLDEDEIATLLGTRDSLINNCP